MAGTFTIPLTTLTIGSHDFGPVAVADADTVVEISIDRTPAGGLTATPAAVVDLTAFQSNDGGASFFPIGTTECVGGVKGGRFANVDNVRVTFQAGTSRQARANVTVSGSSVTVTGTVSTR